MESTTSNIDENGSEKLEQDAEKVSENGEKSQDNVKETGKKNPGENVAVAVGNIAHAGEHNDSSCRMVVEEFSPVPSHSDGRPLETDTKDDGLLKSNTETTHADENSQLEKSPHQSPPPVASLDLDPEKGLVNPTKGSMIEQNKESSQFSSCLSNIEGDSTKVGKDTPVEQESSQVSSDLSKIEGDSAKVGEDNPVDQGRMATVPINKPLEDNVKGTIQNDAEILMEQDKALIEPHSKSLQDQNKHAAVSGIETSKGNENGTGNAGTTNSADHEKGPVQPLTETSMDDEKGSNAPGCETQSKNENEPSKPDVGTSTNLEKGADAPATEASGASIDLDTMTDKDERPDVLATGASGDQVKGSIDIPAAETSSDHEKGVTKLEAEPVEDMKVEVPDSKLVPVDGEPSADAENKDNSEVPQRKDGDTESASMKHEESEPGPPFVTSNNLKSKEERRGDLNNGVHKTDSTPPTVDGTMNSKHSFLLDDMSEGNESGTEEEQSAFMKELENFFRERSMEFKPPKFYGEGLNCLKLWRAVTRLGGYDKVTSCKLWRQVGESFRPPKTCTTVSWTFRGFYEKALLEYERHKVNGGEIQIPLPSHSEPMNVDNQASGSGRARRDAAARAMQGWHSQRLLGNGEVSDPIIKDKSSVPQQKREKQIGTPGLLKRKKPPSTEQAAKAARTQVSKSQLDVTVVDLGPPADWVKINVQRTKDCFEVYALVPGLLREEVRVQSDPAGRLVITGEPENPDNLWGATPFKKVVSLPTRIDPYHTSAVVTLNGQLFVRVPLEQSD